MKEHQLFRSFSNYAILFAAFLFLGILVTFVLGFFLSSYTSTLTYLLMPKNSGLGDHILYAQTLGAAIGVVFYLFYLYFIYLKKKTKSVLPWIAAAIIELILLLVSLADHSFGSPPYVLGSLAIGWLQLSVLLPVIVGYIYLKAKK